MKICISQARIQRMTSEQRESFRLELVARRDKIDRKLTQLRAMLEKKDNDRQ